MPSNKRSREGDNGRSNKKHPRQGIKPSDSSDRLAELAPGYNNQLRNEQTYESAPTPSTAHTTTYAAYDPTPNLVAMVIATMAHLTTGTTAGQYDQTYHESPPFHNQNAQTLSQPPLERQPRRRQQGYSR